MSKSIFSAPQFTDEAAAYAFVEAHLWADGRPCPHCGVLDRSAPLKGKSNRVGLYKCYACRKPFTVKVGTIFEDSPIPLQKWLPALWMLISCKNGVSSWEIHRSLGVSQKSAWFMLHRLRLVLKTNPMGTKLGGKDGGGVEVDETFIGGKLRNMHRDRRARFAAKTGHTGGVTGKTVVQGILDRDERKVRATVVKDVKRETLQNEVLGNVKYGTAVFTDNAVPYDNLHYRYVHEVVNHAERYVNGRVHTNGLENFWSLLKRGLKGTYVAVEPFHLERYVDEQIFRYNNRSTKENPLNDSDRFLLALSRVAGKRITFKELTGKDDSPNVSGSPVPF